MTVEHQAIDGTNLVREDHEFVIDLHIVGRDILDETRTPTMGNSRHSSRERLQDRRRAADRALLERGAACQHQHDQRPGEVLALASAPTFDLNQAVTNFSAIPDENAPFLSRVTQGLYPPGSTFKVVTTTAALESGEFTPDSRFDDTGSYSTPGGPIRNFGGEVYGPHDLRTALTNSINTTFASIGDALGAATQRLRSEAYRQPPAALADDQVE